jgi:type IV secretion system protein VirB8
MFATLKQRFHSGSPKAGVGSASCSLDDEVQLESANWYLRQAKEFEKSKVEASDYRATLADRRSRWFGVIALVAVIAAGAQDVLKRPNPPAVLRVDNATGTVTVLPTTADKVTFGEKADRADLTRYVEMRESYDWETLKDMYNAVRVMSDDQEKEMYEALERGPQSPVQVLKDQARVIAKVGAITFVGDTAQVFFSKSLVPLNQGMPRPAPTYWVATIYYTHVNQAEHTDAQDVDPTGFRVTSFTVARDYTRAPADAAVPSSDAATGSKQ